jgi:hypothetical protein
MPDESGLRHLPEREEGCIEERLFIRHCNVFMFNQGSQRIWTSFKAFSSLSVREETDRILTFFQGRF